ncbi:phosphotransacetylase [Paramicrobacterium agarici]|nr:phosphotransacetylase [Microbacterium agarici]
MVSRSIYITSAEGYSGKSTVALGMLDTLTHQVKRVGVFRPIARSTDQRDYVLELLLGHEGVDLSYDECIGVTYDDVHADPEAALSNIVHRYKAVEAKCDAVVIVGSDFTDVGSPTELGYNARIAANLGAPVLLVLGGREGQGHGERLGQAEGRTASEMRQIADLALVELHDAHATLLAIVANRADPEHLDEITRAIGEVTNGAPVWALPEEPYLVAPTIGLIKDAVAGTLIKGEEELLTREALGVVIAGMSMENVLPRLTEGAVVVVAGDRTETLLAVLLSQQSAAFPSISGVVLNGGFELPASINSLIEGLTVKLPIIATEWGTYDTVMRITHTRGRLAAESQRKFDSALSLFEKHIDKETLVSLLDVAKTDVVTPLMFEYGILDQARRNRRHIVLPEGDDDRVLRAAHTLLARDVAQLTILGEKFEVMSRAIELGLDISAAEVLSPHDPVLSMKFAHEYHRLREHKGVTLEQAREVVTDVSYFGTMMVHTGLADGMVSGAAHTTAHTIRPGFEIIKTKPGTAVVSSVFLMALEDRVLVYGDCAVIPDPTADQLCDIAISSTATAERFGIDPRVAMLSYSTGESGTGAEVDKVREATALVRQRMPEILVEGPIQYDAAADAAVAATKLPQSDVAGRATVFIFPDLNTGNNTYKAVQRSAGAVAIGPVLQGLNKPINDLSRGALVQDIVNTVAITAIQAAS